MRDCPHGTSRVQQVEEEAPEVLFIGNVQGGDREEEPRRKVPMKVTLGDFIKVGSKVQDKKQVKNKKDEAAKGQATANRFRALEVDEDDDEDENDDEIMEVQTVEEGAKEKKDAWNVKGIRNVREVQGEDWLSVGVWGYRSGLRS